MALDMLCQVCGQRIHILVRGRAHRVVCPRCNSIVYSDVEMARARAESERVELPPATEYFRDLLRSAEGLGTASLIVASLGVLVLCIPLVNCLVSAAGVFLGAAGLYRDMVALEADVHLVEEVAGRKWYEKRRILFPLAGTLANLLLFMLAVWPLVH
jgi:hypothetical protein